MKDRKDTGLDRNRAFDINSLGELLTQGKAILTEAMSISRKMEASIRAIQEVYDGIDKEHKEAALGSDLDGLKGRLRKEVYRDAMDRMERILDKLINDVPSYDTSLAQNVEGIGEALDVVKGRVSELKGLLEAGDVDLDYAGLSRRLQEVKAGWDETAKNLAELLAEIENDMLGVYLTSVQYSHDPVNLSTGNFVYEHEDMKIDGKIPLSFHRYYNAKDRAKGSLGRCFVHNYEVCLMEDDEKGKTVIYMGDGQKKTFQRMQDGTYRSLYSAKELLTKEGDDHVLLTLSGRQYIFNKTGKLVREENQQKLGITFRYDELDRLEQAITDHSTFLAYSYNEAGQLIQVTDHAGRTVKLRYERGKLAEAEMPQGNRYIYHYGKNGRLEEVVNPCGYIAVKNSYDEKRRITRQAFPDGGCMEYAYDDGKRQVILTERNKSKIIYVHDSKYRNTDILYGDGTKERFEYNARNQRILYVDRNGHSTRMAYDDKGNLTKIINPLGEKISITYDGRNHPINVKVNGKEKQKNIFDGKGNLIEIRDALLRRTAFTYDEAGCPVGILQPDGSRIRLFYDDRGNVTEHVDARGGKTRYAYDELNRMVEVTDPNGNSTRFSYDQAGNVRTVTNGAGDKRSYEYDKCNQVTKIIDFDGSVIQSAHNALGKPETMTDPLGRVTKLQYDAMWNLSCITKPNGAKTMYVYDEDNRLSQIQDAYGNVTCYRYDGNGNKVRETDEKGVDTHFSYDACGRLIHVEGSDGMKYDYVYDAEGNLTEAEDALGGKIRREYDAAGQLIRETNQMGECRSYTYGPLGKVESMTDEAGRKTRYGYLPGGLLETVIHPENTVERYTYDGNGNVKTYTNVEGFVFTYHYDCLDRITCIEGSDGEKKTYAYDAVGNLISMTDALDHRTKYEHTLTGQLSKVTDPLGNETEYTYDECDELIEIRQYGELTARGRECRTTRCERDLLGRVKALIDPLGFTERYEYDPKGLLSEKMDKEGYLTRYGYTGQGDVNLVRYADGRKVRLSYDPLRRLREMEDWMGLVKIETDLLGRAIKVLYQDDKEVSYTYGTGGRTTSITYPDGKKVCYGYDKDLRLSELKENGESIRYEYDNVGRLIRKRFPNQTETRYAYDVRGRMAQLVHVDREGILDRFTYRYDLLGNKSAMSKERKGLPEESGAYAFRYDPMGRLTEVARNGSLLRTYSYDAFGNRTGLIEKNGKTTYTYNALNQLLSKVDGEGETNYTFDKRGNVTQVWEHGNVKNQYFYGAVNRLERAVNQRGETAQYQYDGFGNRVGKSIRGIHSERSICYTIDLTRQYNNLLQKEESGRVQTYFWDWNVAGMRDDGMENPLYHLQDELGSPVRMTDGSGKSVEHYGYDEFGRELYGHPPAFQPFGYTGYQYDEIAETYFAQAREYDCRAGRFRAVDPYRGALCEVDAMNDYVYCGNNPLIYFDPLGLFPAWLEGIWAHTQIERELQGKQFSCEKTASNIRIPNAGLGITGWGVADFLVDKGSHVEIYEIKPATWSAGYLQVLAFRQLDRYVNGYKADKGRRATRGTQAFADSVLFDKDPSRTLTYWSTGNGLIYYRLSPQPAGEPQEQPAVLPPLERKCRVKAPQRALPRFENPARIAAPEWDVGSMFALGLIGGAVFYTVFTLAEDVFSGGAGVADDFTIPLVWKRVFSLLKSRLHPGMTAGCRASDVQDQELHQLFGPRLEREGRNVERKFKKTKTIKQYFGDVIREEGFAYGGAGAMGWLFFREREGIRQEVILLQHRFFPGQIKLIFHTGVNGWGDVEPRDFLEEYRDKEFWEYGSEQELAEILQEFTEILRKHGLAMLERMLTPKDPIYVTPEMEQCLYDSYESLAPRACLKYGLDKTGEEGIRDIMKMLYENKDRDFEGAKGFLVEMAALYAKVLQDDLGGRLVLDLGLCSLYDIGPTKGSAWPLGEVFGAWMDYRNGESFENEESLMLTLYRQMRASY